MAVLVSSRFGKTLTYNKAMRIIALTFFSLAIFCLGVVVGFKFAPKIKNTKNAIQKIELNPKPLNRYSIEGLRSTNLEVGDISIVNTLAENNDYNSYLIKFSFNPGQVGDKNRTTTGLLNLPNNTQNAPLVILIRGYVDQSIYQTGMGSSRVGQYLAQKGYITIALDYLGYGGSDSESGNIFETRFQTYTTTLALIKTIEENKLPANILGLWNKKIGIWAHSNGGQIALTTLAASQKPIPTVLWAPVTKPFPYSVLYYTDESADEGEFIRRELSKFEDLYVASNFSFSNFIDQIKAPIQLHQGTSDDAVPEGWSSEFVSKLKSQKIDVEYFVYPGADHNLMPSWDETVQISEEFFADRLKNN